MKIALASPTLPTSITDALTQADSLIAQAAADGAAIVCFPETYLPGYPLADMNTPALPQDELKTALDSIRVKATKYGIAIIMPMDWHSADGFQNVAFVISKKGELLGYQTKNQLDPSEDGRWVPGTKRTIFEVDGLEFGISICHEGFRYPETVRWAARNEAAIVFHPNCTGSDSPGVVPIEWGDKNSPYYEKATMMRALENTIYFASINYSFNYPESASAIVAPDGTCIGYQPYTIPGIVVADIDPAKATGLLAGRFNPERY